MTNLRIADHLSLPPDEFVESKLGIIGKSGSGKSGAVKVILEELTHRERPFVCFDPVGIAWGLRSSLDGKSPGLPVLVIGGEHGDLKLERHAGAEIADAILESNISAIIDLSSEPKATYREFAREFCDRIYSKNTTPRHIILDEVPELAPQRLRPDLAPTFEAVERLVTRGRNKGLGVTVVSQRAATINKDLLTQVDALLVFALVSPQDRKALEEWVNDHDQKDRLAEFTEGLSQLQPRQAWWWAPARGEFRRVTIREFTTLHPDRTHLRKMGLLKTRPVTTDVASVVATLGDRLQRLREAKKDLQETPKLRSQIKTLEAEVSRLRLLPRVAPSLEHELHRLESQLKEERARAERFHVHFDRVVKQVDLAAESWRTLFGREITEEPRVISPPILAPVRPRLVVPAPPPTPVDATLEDGQPRVKAGARRMLTELARRHPLTLTRTQLGTLSGFTPSGGTFSDYFSTLKRGGFLAEDRSGNVRVTETGLAFVGTVPMSPTTHAEVMSLWRSNLKAGCYRMLECVAGAPEHQITRETLGEESGFTHTGGTFGDYLSTLRRNSLVRTEGDLVIAESILWPEELQTPSA